MNLISLGTTKGRPENFRTERTGIFLENVFAENMKKSLKDGRSQKAGRIAKGKGLMRNLMLEGVVCSMLCSGGTFAFWPDSDDPIFLDIALTFAVTDILEAANEVLILMTGKNENRHRRSLDSRDSRVSRYDIFKGDVSRSYREKFEFTENIPFGLDDTRVLPGGESDDGLQILRRTLKESFAHQTGRRTGVVIREDSAAVRDDSAAESRDSDQSAPDVVLWSEILALSNMSVGCLFKEFAALFDSYDPLYERIMEALRAVRGVKRGVKIGARRLNSVQNPLSDDFVTAQKLLADFPENALQPLVSVENQPVNEVLPAVFEQLHDFELGNAQQLTQASLVAAGVLINRLRRGGRRPTQTEFIAIFGALVRTALSFANRSGEQYRGSLNSISDVVSVNGVPIRNTLARVQLEGLRLGAADLAVSLDSNGSPFLIDSPPEYTGLTEIVNYGYPVNDSTFTIWRLKTRTTGLVSEFIRQGMIVENLHVRTADVVAGQAVLDYANAVYLYNGQPHTSVTNNLRNTAENIDAMEAAIGRDRVFQNENLDNPVMLIEDVVTALGRYDQRATQLLSDVLLAQDKIKPLPDEIKQRIKHKGGGNG